LRSKATIMRHSVVRSLWTSAPAVIFGGLLCAQAPPAPSHDLTGVWMLRNPAPMRSFAGATFTKEEPEMTPWAQAKYKEAKPSNGGKYTLDTTNDPVLTKCDPLRFPRIPIPLGWDIP
jgi:hypothetical protein